MSYETWVREFYPVPAGACLAEHAAKHSLRKWIGLREANTREHGVNADQFNLTEYTPDHKGIHLYRRVCLHIDYRSCALCLRFLVEDHEGGTDECDTCPLAIVRGGKPCTYSLPDEDLSPWMAWIRKRDPEPMIHWLHIATEYQKEQHK